MKRFFQIAVMASVVVSMQSCTHELEQTNPNFISSANYWSTLEESESNLVSVYAGMLDQYVVGTEYEFLRSDIAYPGQRTRNTGNYIQWHQQTLTADNNEVSRMWDSKYRVVWRANQVIDGLNAMSDELKADERWTQQMAQARFFRGLMHFYLHSTFNNGEIIIVDTAATTPDEFSRSVSTSQEVIDFFRADLEYAYQNLPPQAEVVSRVDAGAAATILGTSYLYEGDYAGAMTYFNDIVNNVNGDYGYQLVQDTDLMFTNAGDYNSESILEINYSTNFQLEDSNFDEESFFHRLARRTGPNQRNLVTRSPFGSQAWLLPSAWLTLGLSTEEMDTQDPRNYIGGDITGTLRNIPLRGSQTIAVVNDEQSNYYGSTAPQVFAFSNTRFSFFKKYTNHDIVTTEFDTGTTGWKSGRNVVLNRLSGVYLMYAECLAQTGDVNGAIGYINEVRKRWGLQLLGISDGTPHDFDGITYSSGTLMEHLMYKEYPFELAFEGFATRLINLRRWGIAADRFAELSNTLFSLANYDYTDPSGGTATRNRSLIQLGAGASEFTEYNVAANSWQANSNLGYYPLPESETLYNPQVN